MYLPISTWEGCFHSSNLSYLSCNEATLPSCQSPLLCPWQYSYQNVMSISTTIQVHLYYLTTFSSHIEQMFSSYSCFTNCSEKITSPFLHALLVKAVWDWPWMIEWDWPSMIEWTIYLFRNPPLLGAMNCIETKHEGTVEGWSLWFWCTFV